MKPLVGCLKYPESYRRVREPGGAWSVYKVPEGKLMPTAEHQALGPFEVIWTGRLARLRSWVYVTFATVIE